MRFSRVATALAVLALLLAGCAQAPTPPPADAAQADQDGDHHGGPEVDLAGEPSDEWEPRDPRLEPAPEGDVHEYEIRVSHMTMELAPGVVQQVWAYNEQIPGPTLRGKVGDTFRITFINDGDMPHSIDFHASKVAPNVEMRSIEPGEELVYEFEAKHAGVYMYHCGSDPVLQHTGIGKHGAVIIDPPDLDPVDHEFYLVQHDVYFGTLGQAHDKMLAEDWDAVVFNGYPFQYVHAPIEGVEPDDRVRMWVMNNGPSENSSFHVIGTIFDTVYKEGSFRLHPDRDAPGGAQALDLQASQGGFVEFTFDTDGFYPFVTHEFVNVPKGAVGAFLVGDVDADASH